VVRALLSQPRPLSDQPALHQGGDAVHAGEPHVAGRPEPMILIDGLVDVGRLDGDGVGR